MRTCTLPAGSRSTTESASTCAVTPARRRVSPALRSRAAFAHDGETLVVNGERRLGENCCRKVSHAQFESSRRQPYPLAPHAPATSFSGFRTKNLSFMDFPLDLPRRTASRRSTFAPSSTTSGCGRHGGTGLLVLATPARARRPHLPRRLSALHGVRPAKSCSHLPVRPRRDAPPRARTYRRGVGALLGRHVSGIGHRALLCGETIRLPRSFTILDADSPRACCATPSTNRPGFQGQDAPQTRPAARHHFVSRNTQCRSGTIGVFPQHEAVSGACRSSPGSTPRKTRGQRLDYDAPGALARRHQGARDRGVLHHRFATCWSTSIRTRTCSSRRLSTSSARTIA